MLSVDRKLRLLEDQKRKSNTRSLSTLKAILIPLQKSAEAICRSHTYVLLLPAATLPFHFDAILGEPLRIVVVCRAGSLRVYLGDLYAESGHTSQGSFSAVWGGMSEHRLVELAAAFCVSKVC